MRKEKTKRFGIDANIAYSSFIASGAMQKPVRPHLPVLLNVVSSEFPSLPLAIDIHTEVVPGEIVPIGKSEVNAGESCYIQLRYEGTLSFSRGIRFRLRDKSGDDLIGEGRVLMSSAPLLKAAAVGSTVEILECLETGDIAGALEGLIRARRPLGVSSSYIKRAFGITEDDLDGIIENIKGIVRIGQFLDVLLMDEKDIGIWAERILRLLKEFHITEPHSPGADLKYVRDKLQPKPPDAILKTTIAKLKTDGRVEENHGIFNLTGFAPLPEDHLAGVKGEAFSYYENAGYSPPRLREAANAIKQPEKRLLGILIYLCKKGYLSRLDRDTFISKNLFDKALDEALSMIQKQGDVELSEFRDALGCSRRIAIALLERFDKKGWTERNGDVRKTGPKAEEP